MKKEQLSFQKISKDLKYIALYTKLGFFETFDENIYELNINNHVLQINIVNNVLLIDQQEYLSLNNHHSFVCLELLIELLNLEISLETIVIDEVNNQLKFSNFIINYFEWESSLKNDKNANNLYSSKLESGVIERRIKTDNNQLKEFFISNELYFESNFNFNSDDLVIENGVVIKINHSKSMIEIPEGTLFLRNSLFWDNQNIKEVKLPNSLIYLGGDTFYNCKNLKKIIIPKNVRMMGDNPFAGCTKLKLKNESDNFIFENGMLFNKEKTRLIYFDINSNYTNVIVPENIKILGKHSFYLGKKIKSITLPKTLIKMQNNPLSGCTKINKINNKSDFFYIYKNKIIYNRNKTIIIGVINNIKCKELKLLETTKVISRNSFWNCKNIKKIYIPKNVENIGYNPFVGCRKIIFDVDKENKYYKVENGTLYNADMSKLICCPPDTAVNHYIVNEKVITLERGAFSGAIKLRSVNLKNSNFISKTCFSNCCNLKEIYINDWVQYIGEWAFSNCKKLEKISVSKNTILDKNLIINSNKCIIEKRQNNNNYLINSDNEYSLLSFQKMYKEKIDLIVIDPPYNSKIDYIEYKDDYKNDYINFISTRISLSKNLLTNEGKIMIFIDKDNLEDIIQSCKLSFLENQIKVYKWEKINDFFDKDKVSRKKTNETVLYEYIVICDNSGSFNFNMIKQPYLVNNQLFEKESSFPEIFSLFGTNWSAKKEIIEDFNNSLAFTTPKPIKIIKELIRSSTKDNSIIIDYFAGSGTTGVACLELNNELNSNRTFLLVTNNENNIFENVTSKRLKKYSEKYNVNTLVIY